MTKCLRRDLNTLEDWIRQIIEFEKTINESLDHMGEAEKTMAEIIGALSDKHTNRDQSAYEASQ